MKKILFLLMMLVCSISSSAQGYYRLTGNNVYVRTGPGTNYGHVCYTGAYGSDTDEYVKVDKGTIVKCRGAVKNGFMPVIEQDPFSTFWEKGWISTQYLTPATKCSVCKGKGYFNQTCPECKGEGYHNCCYFTGKKVCKKCDGVGYY